ncbi:MAG: hypothetical protein ACOC1K_07765 [Nanoarchaeota archaeon]
MISIINDFGNKDTVLKKIGPNLWELSLKFIIKNVEFENNSLAVPNSTIDKKGLQDYIEILKNFMKEKYHDKNYRLKWISNPA